jgi:flagellar protein FliO/FliZ
MSKLTWKLAPTLLVCLVGSLALSSIVAAEGGTPGEGQIAPTPDLGTGVQSFYLVLKVLFFLAIIIGLFLILIRLVAKRNQGGAFGRPIRSIGGVPLGQNKSIQIVTIGKSLYIVGVGDNIQLLEKIDNAEEVSELTAMLTGGQGGGAEFISVGNWLKRLRERQKPLEEEELPSSSFGQVFQEKLQQISSTKKKTQELLEHQHNGDRFDPS